MSSSQTTTDAATQRVTKKGGARHYKKPPRTPHPDSSRMMKQALDVLAEAVFPASQKDAPSVTTILGALAKPALIGWAAKQERLMVAAYAGHLYQQLTQVLEEPLSPEKFKEVLEGDLGKGAHRQILEEAASIGTEVHNRIEWEFKGELGKDRPVEPPPLTTPEAKHSYGLWVEWRKSVQLRVVATEKAIFSFIFGFGGTLDTLAYVTLEGVEYLVVIDYKTGKAIYPESWLQNIAYRMALREEGLDATRGIIVRLPKYRNDPEFEAQVVPSDPLLEPTWIALRLVYGWWHKSKGSASAKPQQNAVAPTT